MPSDIEMKQVLQAYFDAFNRADVDGLMALLADDATVEDPYGSAVKSGRAILSEFYRETIATVPSAPMRGSHGDSAALAYDAIFSTSNGDVKATSVIDVMTFDADCKIKTMRAYFGPSDIFLSHKELGLQQ